MHTTNYINTFIEVAEDCPATKGEAPPAGDSAKTIARLQYEMLKDNAYKFTSDDVLFQVFAERSDLQNNALQAARDQYFSKGQPCFRSSPLTKRYGWGIHSDGEGKIAMYAVDSEQYRRISADKSLKIVKAMRSKKA